MPKPESDPTVEVAKAVHPAPGTPEAANTNAETYHFVADKIGFVPNVRGRDNLIQGLSVLGCAVVGGLGGLVVFRNFNMAGLCMVGGMAVGLVVSGAVVGIMGLKRK